MSKLRVTIKLKSNTQDLVHFGSFDERYIEDWVDDFAQEIYELTKNEDKLLKHSEFGRVTVYLYFENISEDEFYICIYFDDIDNEEIDYDYLIDTLDKDAQFTKEIKDAIDDLIKNTNNDLKNCYLSNIPGSDENDVIYHRHKFYIKLEDNKELNIKYNKIQIHSFNKDIDWEDLF